MYCYPNRQLLNRNVVVIAYVAQFDITGRRVSLVNHDALMHRCTDVTITRLGYSHVYIVVYMQPSDHESRSLLLLSSLLRDGVVTELHSQGTEVPDLQLPE